MKKSKTCGPLTQAYLSMLERGLRSPAAPARKFMKMYSLPASLLPVNEVRADVGANSLAHQLAALGYPGFAHLKRDGRTVNPAEFLLSAWGSKTWKRERRRVFHGPFCDTQRCPKSS